MVEMEDAGEDEDADVEVVVVVVEEAVHAPHRLQTIYAKHADGRRTWGNGTSRSRIQSTSRRI
jgi:hypothetical protein